MDHTNHWYGHAHVLAEYCGLDPANPPPIRGVLQHGWNISHGFGHGNHNDPSLTKLVWGSVSRHRGQAIGWRDYVVIGAPYLYLNELLPDEGAEREGTIWYPFHGTKEYESVHGDHQGLIELIQATESGPVTVCLYYVEYDNLETRGHYESAGFRVICHGRRGALWKGTDREFLFRQIREQRRHRRVASNRLSTAVIYGSALGLEPVVYGDPMELRGSHAGYNGLGVMEHLYPEFYGTSCDVEATNAISLRELGARELMSPAELRIILGWEEPWQHFSS